DPRATSPTPSPSPSVDPTAADAVATAGLEDVVNAATRLGVPPNHLSKANTLALSEAAPEYTYLPSTRASNRPNEVSVSTDLTTWAAASMSESGTCFWIKLAWSPVGNQVTPTYGAGTPCTGSAAMTAHSTDFP